MENKKRSISQAKRKRNGRKYMIVKMIAEIDQLILSRGSRTKLKFLRDSLKESLRDATLHHEELISLLEETDPELEDLWIEYLSLRTNICFSEISWYLKERENETLSSLSSGTAKRQVES